MSKYLFKVLGLIAATFINVCASFAQPTLGPAPLGLSWGLTASDVRSSGVELADIPKSPFGVTFAASKISKALGDQETAILSFGFDDKLWRIVIISKKFPDDPSGSAVMSRYVELSSLLAEKYGKARTVHQLGDSIFSEPKNFISGISMGRTSWYSNFETPELSIQLGLLAHDSSSAGWRIIYENKILRSSFEAARKIREKGSL